jgi:predicted nucleotidyltransferase
MGKEALRQRYERELERVVARLRASYDPEKIVLFGSCARGDFAEDSDLDLLILKKTKQRHLDRMRDVYRLVYSPEQYLALDVLVYTPEEWAKKLNTNDFFAQEINQEGKVLYEREQASRSS